MRYSKDTRTIQPGEYYVAIRGEKFDGHSFVQDAIDKGAAGLVVERELEFEAGGRKIEVIHVDSSERYLAEQALQKIKTIQPDVIGITGSVGKTSTKNAIVKVLEQGFPVAATQGNLNTVLGVALTLLNTDFDAETKLVLEMGASHVGDIAELCAYFPPTISVVTNVHGVHLLDFGSIENVALTKGEIVDALDSDGVACLNYDDPRVRAMQSRNKGKTIFYGTDPNADLTPEVITADIPLLGDHVVYIALAAYSVGRTLGLSDALINKGLSELTPEKGRLVKLPGVQGITLIDDTYNASPAATISALKVLQKQEGARHIAFLGDMLELGESEVEEHVRIMQEAVQQADTVIVVGDIMTRAAATLPVSIRDRIVVRVTSREVVQEIADGQTYQPTEGDVVLVKGSQGVRMEHISRALLRPDIDPAEVLPRQSVSWQTIMD